MKLGSGATIVLLTWAAPFALAHHGKDFLLVESYEIPHPGDVYLVGSAGVVTNTAQTEVELEPSFLVGLVPRAAFELHAHVMKDSDGPMRYEATAPSLHLQITPPASSFPVSVGASAEYEIAAGDHENDRFETRLIGERAFGRAKLVGNFILQHERGGDITPGYGIGLRYDVSEQLACGVEAQGPFTRADTHEVLFGVYAEPTERLTLKVGLGPAFRGDHAALSVHAGIVCGL